MSKKRLEQLLKKREQLSAQIQQIRSREANQKRKKDMRRKILLGALVMEIISKGELSRDKIMTQLDGFLTRDIDRKLFDFTSLKDLSEKVKQKEGNIKPNPGVSKISKLSRESSQLLNLSEIFSCGGFRGLRVTIF